jgi:hypothetical protein
LNLNWRSWKIFQIRHASNSGASGLLDTTQFDLDRAAIAGIQLHAGAGNQMARETRVRAPGRAGGEGEELVLSSQQIGKRAATVAVGASGDGVALRVGRVGRVEPFGQQHQPRPGGFGPVTNAHLNGRRGGRQNTFQLLRGFNAIQHQLIVWHPDAVLAHLANCVARGQALRHDAKVVANYAGNDKHTVTTCFG